MAVLRHPAPVVFPVGRSCGVLPLAGLVLQFARRVPWSAGGF